MKSYGSCIAAASLAGCLCLPNATLAQGTAQPAAGPKGEAVLSQVEVTAKVAKINQKTREVTLKTDDGREATFVADAAVQNLAQVKKGDVITATYTEALAYEVRKHGKTGAEATVAAAAAASGAKPAGAIGQKTTVTVSIAAIDPKAPSVTFKGPGGQTRTIKVQDPSRLEGVSVGNVVDITYAEAIAIKVEKPAKK